MEATDESQNSRVVIIGIGDERRRDDAVGLVIAEELADRPMPGDVRIERAGHAEFDLVAALSDASRAIVLAALELGDEPGTVHCLSPEDAEAQADYISGSGDMALTDALELSSMRGGADVLIVGIEPAEIVPGQTPHPEVQASVGQAAELAHGLATGAREWRFFARGDYG